MFILRATMTTQQILETMLPNEITDKIMKIQTKLYFDDVMSQFNDVVTKIEARQDAHEYVIRNSASPRICAYRVFGRNQPQVARHRLVWSGAGVRTVFAYTHVTSTWYQRQGEDEPSQDYRFSFSQPDFNRGRADMDVLLPLMQARYEQREFELVPPRTILNLASRSRNGYNMDMLTKDDIRYILNLSEIDYRMKWTKLQYVQKLMSY